MRVWALTGQTPRVWSDPNRKKVCFYGSLNLLNGRVTVTRTEMRISVKMIRDSGR